MTSPADVPVPPPRLRTFALLCVVLTSFVGLFSLSEALGLNRLQQQRELFRENAPQLSIVTDPELLVAMNESQTASLEGMKQPRGFVLGALTLTCFVAFVCVGRLLRPDGLPRQGVRRVLAGSLFAAAALRAIDGAQWAVVAQRMGARAVAVLEKSHTADPALASIKNALPPLMVGGVALHTLLVAGGFLMLAQYFRSEPVKQFVAQHDARLENE